jgi:hypothetical protein
MEEKLMSLLRDLIVTVGDGLRLSSDLMRHKVAVETQALKRTASRMVTFLALALFAVLLAGAGVGFLLYGVFILIAKATGLAAAGLIVGFVLLLLAVVVFLIGRSAATRPAQ